MNETKLGNCLDDSLTAADWLALLNERVFFWVGKKKLDGLLDARLNRERDRMVLALRTLRVATSHADRVEFFPVNSGSTIHQPARRDRTTFTPLLRHDYPTWQWLRNKATPDRIVEVTVVGGVDDIADLVIERHLVSGAGRLISLPPG